MWELRECPFSCPKPEVNINNIMFLKKFSVQGKIFQKLLESLLYHIKENKDRPQGSRGGRFLYGRISKEQVGEKASDADQLIAGPYRNSWEARGVWNPSGSRMDLHRGFVEEPQGRS